MPAVTARAAATSDDSLLSLQVHTPFQRLDQVALARTYLDGQAEDEDRLEGEAPRALDRLWLKPCS